LSYQKTSSSKTSSKEQIIRDVEGHVQKCGGPYSKWYAGIATDPDQRLFTDHNVNRKTDAWIFRKAKSEQDARYIEKYFLRKGMKGGTGGGKNPRHFYAYKMNNHTRP